MQEQIFKNEPQKQEIFKCICCQYEPFEPVVTQCGHIFCWKCLYKSSNPKQKNNQCPLCGVKIDLQKCYPIFIQHEERQKSDLNMPLRPSPKYSTKIINPGATSSNLPPGLAHIQNNIEIRKATVGLGYFPSLFSNTFNQIQQPKGQSKDRGIHRGLRKFSILLGFVLTSVVIWILIL